MPTIRRGDIVVENVKQRKVGESKNRVLSIFKVIGMRGCSEDLGAFSLTAAISRKSRSFRATTTAIILIAIYFLVNFNCCSGYSGPVLIKGHLRVSNVHGTTNVVQYEEDFGVRRDPATKEWQIDDFTDAPKTAFTFRDFVIDRANDRYVPLPQFAASAYIDGGYPIDLDQDQRALWFVYCAKEFLKAHDGKPVVLPDQPARFVVNIYGCRAHIRWRAEGDICPAMVDFVFERDLMKNFSENMSFEGPGDLLNQRQQWLDSYLSWATNGMLRGRFEVAGWTNFAGESIPVAWSFNYFRADSRKPVRIFEGHATVFGNADLSAYPFPAIAQLKDRRVRELGALNYASYRVTNGEIPGLDDQALRKKVVKLSRGAAKQMPKDLGTRRAIIIVAFIAIISLPSIFMLLKHRGAPA